MEISANASGTRDVFSAFDIVDHTISLQHLKLCCPLGGHFCAVDFQTFVDGSPATQLSLVC